MICKWCGDWYKQQFTRYSISGYCSYQHFILDSKLQYNGKTFPIVDPEDSDLLQMYYYFPIYDGYKNIFVREDITGGWHLCKLSRDIKSREVGRNLLGNEHVYRKNSVNDLDYRRENFYIKNVYPKSGTKKKIFGDAYSISTYKVVNNMIEIYSNSYQNSVGYVDVIDLDVLENEIFYFYDSGNTFYIRVLGFGYGIHRCIMEKVIGRKLQRGELVDHIDHNGLNNRRNNLRIVNSQQNSWNSRKPIISGNSKHKGVRWLKKKAMWEARLKYNGEYIVLGWFDTELKAAVAYNVGAMKYFGEYACLNCFNDK